MKKFTTLETNDDVKKAVKQAAHMLELADAEKVVLDTHEASMSDLKKQYSAALDAYIQAKRSGEGLEEKGAELKKIEDATNELDAAARYSKYLLEGYKYAARLHYATAAVELVNLNAQYLNGANAGYKQVRRVTMAIEDELGGARVSGAREYVDGPANVSIYNVTFGGYVQLYVSLGRESYNNAYRFDMFDRAANDTVTINVTHLEQNEHIPTPTEIRAAAKKMLTLKQKLHDERDKYQTRIKKLYEPCSMFSDAREAYNRAYSARY